MTLMKSALGDEICFGRHMKESTVCPEKQMNRGQTAANQKREAMDQENKQQFQIWALN